MTSPPEPSGVGTGPAAAVADDVRAAADQVVVTLARLVRDGEVTCHGVNSIVPALALMLARQGHAPSARQISIGGGLDGMPPSLPRSSSGSGWLSGSPVVLSNVDVYQLALRGRVDLMLLGCVQVDAHGRVNSTVIGSFDRPEVRLPGGGGAAVLFQVVRRIVVYRTRHEPRALPIAVDFVTATGNLDRVVTPLAVFRATPGGLKLEGFQPGASLDAVRTRTGFAVVPTEDCAPVPPPTVAERQLLERLDPDRLRDLDFL